MKALCLLRSDENFAECGVQEAGSEGSDENNDEDKDVEEDKGIDEGYFKEGSGKKR